VPQNKPNRFAAFMNSPKVAAALLVVLAMGCLVGVVITYGSATALSDSGVRVTADVVEVHTEGRDDYVVVTFPDARGERVTAEVGNYKWQPTPQVGDRPVLVYDPEDPSGNVADARMGPDYFSVWACAIGGLVAVLLVVPTWTGRLDWNKLR